MVSSTQYEESDNRVRNMVEPSENRSLRISGAELSEDLNENENHNPQENVNSDKEDDGGDHKSEEHSSENEKLSSTISSCISSQNCLEEARCSESMPSSDSNKENIDSNVSSQNYVEFDPSDYIVTGETHFGEYDNTDQIPLPQLLKIHVKQLVSGFEFGEATKRRAQENMKTARDKNKKTEEVVEDTEPEESDLTKPSCSNVSEVEHKTPHSRKRQRLAEAKMNLINSDKDFGNATRRVPECLLTHPDCVEVWTYMIFKEEASLKLRNPRLFNDFKSVTPRMRAILLDWLMEVAAVYHLRRVTYYLSVDYFDRFLSIRPDIPKSLLQLVGITCLYIAAKVEEIYPPNLSEFSYVCDGACKSKEMVSCELLILNSLGWEVVLTTPSDWLNLYMQLHFKSSDVVRTTLNMDFNKDFIFPQYSAYQFTRASQLMDLLSLDPGFLKFGYSVVAAASMYFMYGEDIALAVSGLSWQQLQPCVEYMEVFYCILEDSPDPRLHSCLGGPHPEEINRLSTGLLKRMQSGPQNENYSFQTHVASMDYFERATIVRLTRFTRQKTDSSEPESKTVEEGTEEPEGILDETLGASLVDDLNSLEELSKNQTEGTDENLMSLDEIFELILSQDEKSTNSD